MAVVAIDAVLGAELAELAHCLGRPARDPGCTVSARQPQQGEVLHPIAGDEAAVPPAGAGAAEILLHDDDAEGGVGLLQADRRPEPEIAATDNADVGRAPADRLFGCQRSGGGNRFLEPECLGHRLNGQ